MIQYPRVHETTDSSFKNFTKCHNFTVAKIRVKFISNWKQLNTKDHSMQKKQSLIIKMSSAKIDVLIFPSTISDAET